MKKFTKHYLKEIIGLILIVSIIGSFFQEGFYIYGVVLLTLLAVIQYEPKTITHYLKDKEEAEKKKLIDYLDRKEEIREKKKNDN